MANRIARWNGTGWSALGGGVAGGASPVVTALAVAPNGDVVAGGNFTSAGGQPAQGLARWNGSTWQEVTGGVQEGEVLALAYDGDDLWVGGGFTKANTYNVTVLPPNDAPYLEINDIYEGTVMEDPGTLTLRATSSDGDGGLVSVEFFLNGPRVAHFTDQLDRWYFEHLWNPVPAGEHTFRVVSTDTDGATTERVVHFTVTPFNEPPEVTLFAPPDGPSVGMPNSVPLTVEASDPDGSNCRSAVVDRGRRSR